MKESFTHVISGGFAGLLSEGISHPLDTIRVRMQMEGHTSTIGTIKSIFKKEGIRAFYKG
jgi:hypothetical protein